MRNGNPAAMSASKTTPFGSKTVLTGTMGGPADTAVAKSMLPRLLTHGRGHYAELSDAAKAVAQKQGLKPLPYATAEKVLPHKTLKEIPGGGGAYVRNIEGLGDITKAIFGNPNV